MLKIECKKIFIHQKGLVILLLSLLAYTLLCVCSGYDSNYAINRSEDTYRDYIERWHGEITEVKASELDAEYNAINHVSEPEIQNKRAVFLEVYNQYFYAKEKPSRRFLMDERGWNTLLTHDNVNFIFILCLLAICIPVFCGEYQCGMEQILRTCRNGRARLAMLKLLLMMMLAMIIALLFQLIQFGVVSSLVGLDGADYPLQSLSFFEKSPYTITIGGAYGIVIFCRCIGAAWFSVLIALLSILCQRASLTTFSGIAIGILPHLFSGGFLKYVLPLPAGLLAGNGYLWGTISEPRYNDNWKELSDVVIFPGIGPTVFCVLLVVFLVLIGIQFYIALRRYVGAKKHFPLRRMAFGIFAFILLFGITGCSYFPASEQTYDFFTDSEQGQTETYQIELDRSENQIYAKNRESGQQISLIRNSFDAVDKTSLIRNSFDMYQHIECIFVTEEACYYCVANNIGIGKGFKVYRIDLQDFSNHLFFSNIPDNTTDLWGLYEKKLSQDEIMENDGGISSFMIDGMYIYYLRGERLYRVSRLTGHETIVVSNVWDMQKLQYKNGEIVFKK